MGPISLLPLLFLAVFHVTQAKRNPDHIEIIFDPDMLRNVSALITSKGYPVEEHTVQTKDGFLLGVQRIPHGKGNIHLKTKRKIVFLQHGLLSSSANFVINFPEQSLGFILADAGYDVWLGNTRGNTYSRHHIKYDPRSKEFWDFSFDEMAEYDLPAMIDYVLNSTGEDQLFYIGHSQGTTSAFAMLSENAKLNEKVKLFIALAPVATVGYITSAISYLAPFTSDIDFLLELLGVNEFLPSNTVLRYLNDLVCSSEERFLCEDIMFLLFGTDKYQLNQTRIGVYSAHSPAGSSTRSVVHYAQLVNSKKFTKYDYGKKENLVHYNQTIPPEYDVSKITAPIALMWSLNDKLADPTDVGILKETLKTVVVDYCVPFPFFNHGDFCLALDAHELLYDRILSLLSEYTD